MKLYYLLLATYELSPMEAWMVQSNLNAINDGADAAILIAIVRSNGYHRVADAIKQHTDKGECNASQD